MLREIPVLYSFCRCPYAMRARFALKYAQITFYLREINLKNKPPQMLKISPKGTVPVLQLSSRIIDESLEIIKWALAQNDPDNILNKTQQEQNLANNLIQYNDNNFVKILHEYKYPDWHPQVNFETTKINIFSHLENIENYLTQNKFLVSNNISIADIAIFPFIRQLARINEEEFRSWPFKKIINWLDYFLAHPVYKASMKKYPLWQNGPGELF